MRAEDIQLLERLGMLHCWRCLTAPGQVAQFNWFEPPLRVVLCNPCGEHVSKVMVEDVVDQLFAPTT